MILNQKTVDPRQPESTPVYQIESAAGSAISVFKNSAAIRVPRTRFAPVKNTNDLLAVRSDRYILTEDFKIIPTSTQKKNAIEIDLDSRFYKMIDDFESRFASGIPLMEKCKKLRVIGDVIFGKLVKLIGDVEVVNQSENQLTIKDNTTIKHRLSNPV
jgi:UTP--glucose-1-phosphate uridylyltransferase